MRLFNHNCQMLGDNIQIHSIGCEASMSDTYNFACTLPLDKKAIVFGTCSFIEDRSMESIMLTDILHRAYPDHDLYIIGCDVNNHKEVFNAFPNVYTNEEVKVRISDRKIISGIKIKGLTDEIEDRIIMIKVQDGCQFKCSYCIINKLRNKPYSVPYKEIVNLIKEQIEMKPNYSKIVLCGTEISSYKDEETGYTIANVLRNLVQDVPEAKRITLSAVDPHPKETLEMLDIIAENKDKYIPYLLLGVQSGSDTILKAMKRRHNVEEIRAIHSKAKKLGITLGWDIIVGFPGETNKLFNETYDLMKELQPFTQNIFIYSDREGTVASTMNNKISKNVKILRDRMLHELIEEYAINNPAFKPYDEYAEEFAKYEQVKVNRQRALEIMFNEFDSREMWVGILDREQVADLIKNRPENTLIHVTYDMERDVECEIIINFLKNVLRGFPLIVHAPYEFADKYNVKDFEKLFHCIVVLEAC